MVQTAVALAMPNLKKKPRWQAAPTPTGDYGEQWLVGNDVESRVYLGSLTYGVKELSEALEKVTFPPIM